MTNTRKLKALMVEHGFTQSELAMCLGISTHSLNRKINNKCEFKASEISNLIVLLLIDDVNTIFFDTKVS